MVPSAAFAPQSSFRSPGRICLAASLYIILLMYAVSRRLAYPTSALEPFGAVCSTASSGFCFFAASSAAVAVAFLSVCLAMFASFFILNFGCAFASIALSAAFAAFFCCSVSFLVLSAAAVPPAATLRSSCASSGVISSLLYVSQNSRFADPCSSLRIRSGSRTPGISTISRPCCPSSSCMFGCTTPNLSIRVRTTLNEFFTASSTAVRSAFSTSLSELCVETFPFSCCVANISARRCPGAALRYALMKSVMKSL